MPSLIPHLPPPQVNENNPPKQPAQRMREESFREVLRGAKKQIKPKPKDSPEVAADARARAPKEPGAGAREANPQVAAERDDAIAPAPAEVTVEREEHVEKPQEPATPQPASKGTGIVMQQDAEAVAGEPDSVESFQADPEAHPESGVAAVVGLLAAPIPQNAQTSNVGTDKPATVELQTQEAAGALIVGAGPVSDQEPESIAAQASPLDSRTSHDIVGDGITANQLAPVSAAPHAASDGPAAASPPLPGEQSPRTTPSASEAAQATNSAIAPQSMMASHDDGGAGQQRSMNDDVEQPVRDGQATRSPLSGATADFHASTQIAADAPVVDADTAAILTGQKPDSASAMKLVPPPAARIADPVEARFAEANHPRIVTAVQSELMPSGGTVRLRLDPPELGALLVRIDVKDGVLAASFQTSNDEATRLLSRSMQQLKTTLESHGVTVEKLHVQQAPREQWDGGRGGDDRQQNPPQHWQQQEQQRREMLQRMWRRVRDGRDPFDLVA